MLRAILFGMASALVTTPREQAKLLRDLADEVERDGAPLPPDTFASIADLAAHRSRRAQLEALDLAAGAWRDADHPELRQGAAEHIAEARRRDDDLRAGVER
jgi:hypothetical protein